MKKMKSFTIEMVKESFELKKNGVDMFVELCPHCGLVVVRFYGKGWAENSEADFSENIYFGCSEDESIKRVRDYIKKIKGEKPC